MRSTGGVFAGFLHLLRRLALNREAGKVGKVLDEVLTGSRLIPVGEALARSGCSGCGGIGAQRVAAPQFRSKVHVVGLYLGKLDEMRIASIGIDRGALRHDGLGLCVRNDEE